ncbi:MAG TPA: flagellar basal body L-ring protein FlgH [Acidobacteriaceae bacterium]|jgi:flagellar L-ring protein precursor FlgH
MLRTFSSSFSRSAALLLLASASLSSFAGLPSMKKKAVDPAKLRADYLTRLQQANIPAAEEHTVGSLWTPQSTLGDLASDYKARHLNDTITILVSVQTTAAQSGTANTSRQFSTNSAITGIFGQTPSATNPLLAANSATALKGSGQTSSNTLFSTTLTGQVISVLPSGNLVVEAQREIFMNNQHENIVVRGMIRPGDIGPNNIVPSAALSNLEIEMKGKGIISDSVRRPNPITRAVLWLFGF